MSSPDDPYEAFIKDKRTPCNYGAKCYQKNQAHREKYKHPPVVEQEKKVSESTNPAKKRTWLDRKEDSEARPKSPDVDSDTETTPQVKKLHRLSPDKNEEIAGTSDSALKQEEPCVESVPKEDLPSKTKAENDAADSPTPLDEKELVKEKFLVKMPPDFYLLYEFCNTVSPKDPCAAFKVADLLLVGPYDILNAKLSSAGVFDKDQYLRHWRYFYDPPEFQTVIKGNDKQGLHFGYWRDEPNESPVFVAKNCSKIDCKIKPVAENIFGAIDNHLEEKLKSVNPFEKPKFASLHQRLKKFATEHDVQLEKSTIEMRARERRVVARTFHGAGIVVPYDKKTQLGYRELAETDANLKKILNRLDEAKTDEERIGPLVQLEELERLTTIAADECDFGTCLEFGHDLFSSGSKHVQSIAIRILSTAYTLLNRLEFLEIIKAHYKDRKEDCDLGIV